MPDLKKIPYFTEESEPCADVIGQADALATAERERGIKAAQLACAPQTHHKFDGFHCIEEDCGIEMPSARLRAGRIRCVDCQTLLEKQAKTQVRR